MSCIGSYCLSIRVQHKKGGWCGYERNDTISHLQRALEAYLRVLDSGKMEEKGLEFQF